MRIEASMYINDYILKKRSWLERLFSKPLESTKVEYCPTVLMFGDVCFVSYQTYGKIQNGEIKIEEVCEQ